MAKKSKKASGGSLKLYKSYVFRDKDPIIDQVRTVVQDTKMTYKKISADSGVAADTLGKWFGGTTKRPQFASMNAVLRACGHEFVIQERTTRRK